MTSMTVMALLSSPFRDMVLLLCAQKATRLPTNFVSRSMGLSSLSRSRFVGSPVVPKVTCSSAVCGDTYQRMQRWRIKTILFWPS